MWTIRDAGAGESATAIAIWQRAVAATHDFLSPEDFAEIKEMVRGFLPDVPLTFAVDADGTVAGFMVLSEGHLDALFIDPAAHGQGAGRALVAHALAQFPRVVTDVNEQNAGAAAFYERLGFTITGRSERDDQGRPYPLLHLVHEAGASPAATAEMQGG
ncbi:acetyltransferase [Stappia indica]|uniref:acetyltransferase n=1 Tax=Stappia indica TaxID=538381 RepID=UPI00082EFDF9|nr:acetyltransferase [Stappia indica]